MKRKIYGFILLLTLVLCVGCNKNKKGENAELTATATPTPTPVNLAKSNLDKLPEQFDKLMSYLPQTSTDPEKGIGYDFTLEISLGQQVAELLGLTDLESIRLAGTVDTKDTMAANFDLCINDDKLMNAHLFADSENFLFNLPEYCSNYATATWEELLSSVPDDAASLKESNILPTINTVDNKNAVLSDAKMTALFRKYLVEFTECFVPVEISAENFSISNGDYLLAGKKHTARANTTDLYAILQSLEAELQNYYEDYTFNTEELKNEGASAYYLDYYISENGDYAWAVYPDTAPKEQFVFINTALGFCLYTTAEDGSSEVLMYSEKTTENSGTVIIPATGEDEAELGTIDYEYNNSSFTMQAMLEDIVFTLETAKVNDTIRYDMTIVAEGISMVLKETVAPTYIDMSCSLASFGLEYLTMSMSTDIRNYEEIPFPQNTVSLDAWTEELNQEALLSDITELLQKYPALSDFMAGFLYGLGEGLSQEDTGNSSSLSEDYTSDFSSLTGYTVTDGYVDFYPPESEVLALGQPSTGMDTLAITEDGKNALLDYAKNAIPNCDASVSNFYNIWGSVEYNDVQSYYSEDYYFIDSKNADNSITVSFDAVSGAFASVDIYHRDKDTALNIANDIIALLGIDYTVTAELAENYTFAKNLSFSGYDGSEYGSEYYNVSFSVYYPEW